MRRSELVSHIDFFDTVCDYAKVSPQVPTEGRSWRPLIERAKGDDVRRHSSVFVEYHGDCGLGGAWRAVVSERQERRYKYIYTPGDVDELYDLTDDPAETESLSRDRGARDTRASMREELFNWMRDTDDPLEIGRIAP
jgi:arylsulfatase A-like enzyme